MTASGSSEPSVAALSVLDTRGRVVRPGLLVVTQLAGVSGLRIGGEIDLGNLAFVREILTTAIDRIAGAGGDADVSDGDVYLDLSDVTFVDVAGARLLVQLAGRLGRLSHRRLVLGNPPRSLRTILRSGFAGASGIEVLPP